MDFVWEWADRVLVFSEGELLADDRPEHIFGDEELLKRASLRQPVLYQLPGHPKTIEEWETVTGKGRIRGMKEIQIRQAVIEGFRAGGSSRGALFSGSRGSG